MYSCSCFFFFKQKTAYDLRISDWSSDVCSSDLASRSLPERTRPGTGLGRSEAEIERRSRREAPLPQPTSLLRVRIVEDADICRNAPRLGVVCSACRR